MAWPEENPFSTRRIRPGALEFLFPAGTSVHSLLDRFEANRCQGQIIGPHGSGKSTLLTALIPAIEQSARPVLLLELHDGQRCLPLDLRSQEGLGRQAVIVVDGYEQLSGWNRSRLSSFCRQRGCGLLVTAHAPVGLPDLYQMLPSLESVQQLVVRLLPVGVDLVSPAEMVSIYDRHGGNLREVLFELYDLYEARRPHRSIS